MRKILLIAILSAFTFCHAQTHSIYLGYSPWGSEWISDLDLDYSWNGNYKFGNPALKFAFEFRGKNYNFMANKLELVYANFTAKRHDSKKEYKISQYGFFWHPGAVILPSSRFQIPFYLGVGFNYYNSNEGDFMNYFFFDLSASLYMKLYFTYNLALQVGYSIHWGLDTESKEFRQYPEIGLLYSFK